MNRAFLLFLVLACLPAAGALLVSCDRHLVQAGPYGIATPTPTATPTPPPTSTPTSTPTACPAVLFNGSESLVENGNWTGANALRSLSTLNVTQGTNSMDVNIVSGVGWNDNFLLLDSFTPNVWSAYSQLKADLYVDAGVVAGASYTEFLLFADSGANSLYYIQISSTVPLLVAGSQTVTWNLDFPNSITSGMALSGLRFIYNNNASSAIGHIYLDNIRFCP